MNATGVTLFHSLIALDVHDEQATCSFGFFVHEAKISAHSNSTAYAWLEDLRRELCQCANAHDVACRGETL